MSVIVYIMDCTGHAFTKNPLHEQIYDTLADANTAILKAHPRAKHADVEDTVGGFYLLDDDCREADSDQAWIEELDVS
jgi:hypothetical protein